MDVTYLDSVAGVVAAAVVVAVAADAHWRGVRLPTWKRTMGWGMGCFAAAYVAIDAVEADVVGAGPARTSVQVVAIALLLAGMALKVLAFGRYARSQGESDDDADGPDANATP
jgi:uncharacterized membrane protein YidH (DUF202 family)